METWVMSLNNNHSFNSFKELVKDLNERDPRMDTQIVNSCHHYLQVDIDTASSLYQLREYNFCHSHSIVGFNSPQR